MPVRRDPDRLAGEHWYKSPVELPVYFTRRYSLLRATSLQAATPRTRPHLREGKSQETTMNSLCDFAPQDVNDQTLISNVHPPDWMNPVPASRYHLVVVGAGTAGLVAAAGAAGLGAKVALVERHLLGGDCLNAGCVPSKCIIRSSRVQAELHDAGQFGFQISGEVEVDFARIMERMRSLRARISFHDSVKRFQDLGVDVFLGTGRFTGPDALEVDGRLLRFKKAVIATGSRPVRPPTPGLEEAGYLTNETVFFLRERPRRLAVIGGGPIGCELAQAFRRLGCEVTLFHKNARLLNREDPDAAEVLRRSFIDEGMRLILNCTIQRIEKIRGQKVIRFQCPEGEGEFAGDEILVGVGRAPNVEGLNLEAAGVEYDLREGVKVNDFLQTSNPSIYAAGDICLRYKFTHMADAAARIVLQNALFIRSKKLTSLTVPWCTFTDPEIAHVGMYEGEAQEKGIQVVTFQRPLSRVDRAIIDGEKGGFVKIHLRNGTDKILGATIVARHAGEMLNEITMAIAGNIGLRKLSEVIHPYPTQAEAIKQVADDYNRNRLTPSVRKWLARWMEWRS